ncbi:MAG: efflux transporter outer membrane subunit [Tannerellaceae bacterium]|nr:efflux transporter outer membrane subunit [Tannerellaceae bacterium]
MKHTFFIIRLLILLPALLCLAGCNIYRKYERPEVNVAGLYRDPYSITDTLHSDTLNMAHIRWDEMFTDDKLQHLIETGLHYNADLLTAKLRIEEAEATLMASRLAFLPSLGISAEGTISSFDGSKAAKTWQLPFVSSWELDLAGRLFNASRGAYASLIASEAYRRMVQSSLIANIANLYYTLLMLDQQLEISESTLEIWEDNVRVMEALKQAGMTNEAGVVQSRANVYQVEASLYDLRQQIRETENALAILLGYTPQYIERNTLAEQQLPDSLQAGIPAQLLSNRPDVQYAEMQLASAYYATNQARSAFYPQLTLSGTLGWINSAGTAVTNPGKMVLSAVASLTQPLFNRGANIANLRIAKAQQEEALISFNQALLTAGQEVSDALYQFEASNERIIEYNAQIEELEKAVVYTQALFRTGDASYLEILTAQQSLLSARLTEVNEQYNRLQAIVNLYKALGGGS